MFKINSIGVIGLGFVGTAVKNGFEKKVNVETYDKYSEDKSTCTGLEELVSKTKILFLCLPTPMNPDGSCDLSIIRETVLKIDELATKEHVAVIKSTVLPGTTSDLNQVCAKIQVVFNPEFLTEANYIEDFKNQTRIVLGGPRPGTTVVKTLYKKVFEETPIIKTGSTTAEFVKYFLNCFLATKVSFANEFKQVCDRMNVDFDKVVEYALYDKRVGNTHFSVPGPDGQPGFGGSCFPKDLNAFINLAERLDVNSMVLSSVWKKNLELRPEKDWEKLLGRAVNFAKKEK
jgi:nucleotide sugar dehydrogenase